MSNETFMALASCLQLAKITIHCSSFTHSATFWSMERIEDVSYFRVISLHQKHPSVALPSAEIHSATLKEIASKSPLAADHTTEPERCLTALQCGQ